MSNRGLILLHHWMSASDGMFQKYTFRSQMEILWCVAPSVVLTIKSNGISLTERTIRITHNKYDPRIEWSDFNDGPQNKYNPGFHIGVAPTLVGGYIDL